MSCDCCFLLAFLQSSSMCYLLQQYFYYSILCRSHKLRFLLFQILHNIVAINSACIAVTCSNKWKIISGASSNLFNNGSIKDHRPSVRHTPTSVQQWKKYDNCPHGGHYTYTRPRTINPSTVQSYTSRQTFPTHSPHHILNFWGNFQPPNYTPNTHAFLSESYPQFLLLTNDMHFLPNNIHSIQDSSTPIYPHSLVGTAVYLKFFALFLLQKYAAQALCSMFLCLSESSDPQNIFVKPKLPDSREAY